MGLQSERLGCDYMPMEARPNRSKQLHMAIATTSLQNMHCCISNSMAHYFMTETVHSHHENGVAGQVEARGNA